MSPVPDVSTTPAVAEVTTNGNPKNGHVKVSPEMFNTAILHRTPFHPPTAVSAEGIYVTLSDGKRIIDGVGGAAVTCIGNGNARVIKAIQDQVQKMAYIYSMQLTSEPAEELAKVMLETAPGVFELVAFCSGGSEAMEAALKLARQYYYETGQPQRKNFISRNLSYHGNTLGALALSGHPARRKAYEPILNDASFHKVSAAYAARYKKEGESDVAYVERLAKELDNKFQELGPETVIAFAAETVVGASTGCVPAPKGYFKAMKAVCDKYGALLILDEVMSGMGRMGTIHAWESFGDGVHPDIQAVAKGLGGGYVPIGAVLMSKKVATGIRDGSGFWGHGHTYQAHPISAAGSLAIQAIIKEENLMENCRTMGARLEARLRSTLLSKSSPAAPYIFDIRGGGLFWGIEFELSEKTTPKPFGALVQAKTMEKGLIVIAMAGSCEGGKGDFAMLAPPYNVTAQEIDMIVDIFVESVEDLVKEHL